MLSCRDIANYFLILVDDEAEDIMTNLKLQKLIYYAQGFYLALYGKPLFNEQIEAWTHGPVVPDLYHHFKQYGSTAIPKPDLIDFNSFSKDQKELLDEVYKIYGQYSAWKLRDLTHEEPTWKNNFKKGNNVISHSEMQEYFKTLLV